MTLLEMFYNCAYKIKYEQVGDDVNYAFVEQKDKLYIYFQCSASITDWVLNFWFTSKVYKMYRVHKGFYHSYSQIRNIVLDKCYSKKYEQIISIGYSLGGALCQLAFEDIVFHFPNTNVVGYAFESPRCLKVPKEHKHLWNGLYLIRNNDDLITHLPPRLFGFTDLGKMIQINGDTSLVKNKMPKCLKSHYEVCVMNGLEKWHKKYAETENSGIGNTLY